MRMCLIWLDVGRWWLSARSRYACLLERGVVDSLGPSEVIMCDLLYSSQVLDSLNSSQMLASRI